MRGGMPGTDPTNESRVASSGVFRQTNHSPASSSHSSGRANRSPASLSRFPGWTNERQGSVSRSSLSIYPASILDAKTLLACVKVAANTRFGLLKQNIDLVLFLREKGDLFCPSMKIGSLSSFFAKSYYLN